MEKITKFGTAAMVSAREKSAYQRELEKRLIELAKSLASLEEAVLEADACPSCGEARMDWLIWEDDGETVRCETCGVRYRPACAGPSERQA